MLPVARKPITSQLSISVAFSMGQIEDSKFAGFLDDCGGVDVGRVLEARSETPGAADEMATLGRDRLAGASALAGEDVEALAVHGGGLGRRSHWKRQEANVGAAPARVPLLPAIVRLRKAGWDARYETFFPNQRCMRLASGKPEVRNYKLPLIVSDKKEAENERIELPQLRSIYPRLNWRLSVVR